MVERLEGLLAARNRIVIRGGASWHEGCSVSPVLQDSVGIVSAAPFGADPCVELGRVELGQLSPSVAPGHTNIATITQAGAWLAATHQLLRKRRPARNGTAQLQRLLFRHTFNAQPRSNLATHRP
jgi:hypothetical protein